MIKKQHNILITGGSGFVGTQVAHRLNEEGFNVTVVDRDADDSKLPYTVYKQDYADFITATSLEFDTVIHLAAEHIVPQSIEEPEKYYTNNVVKMKILLDTIVKKGIKNIIFSSTGNLYGSQGLHGTLSEDQLYDPQNPYASSKVIGELMIKDYARSYNINYVIFRFFNASGADPEARFGYMQRPATHVIPVLCNKLLNNEKFNVYGTDYPTPDGTCVRDYVHVADLADAHLSALHYIENNSGTFNLGGGSDGVSVKDLVQHASNLLNTTPVVEYKEKRIGDPAKLTADISKAAKLLNWMPKYNVKDAILHAWNWEKKIETGK